MTDTPIRKITLNKFGTSFRDCTEIVDDILPAPGPDEVLVRNVYAGVNGIFDHNSVRNKVSYMKVTLPADMGVESTGIIEAVGPDVTNFAVGDAVITSKVGTGYRTHQIAETSRLFKVPEASAEILALYPTGVSGLVGLEQAGQLAKDEVVSVSAAAGGLGHIVVQIAKRAGNHVIGIVGSDAKADSVRSIGADRVINYKTEDVDQVLKDEYPDGINLAYDSVGGVLFDTLVDNLAVKGRLVVTGYTSDATSVPEQVTQPRIYHKLYYKAASIRAFMNPFYTEFQAEAAGRLLKWYADGDIKVMIDSSNFEGLEQVADAVEHLMAGQNMGKVVVRLSP